MKKLILGLITCCFVMFSVAVSKGNTKITPEIKIKAAKDVPAFFADNDKDKDKDKKKSKDSKSDNKSSSASKDTKTNCPSAQKHQCTTRPYSSGCCHKGSNTTTTKTTDNSKDK